MSEDSPDLEPIDVTLESPAPSFGADPSSGAWSPGWYADPWTAGQYRYWSGQTWTGETNRWGPTTASAIRSPGATDPWPSMSTPVASGYGWTSPTSSADAPTEKPGRRRGPLIAGVTALVVAVLLSGAIGFAIDSHSHSSAQGPAATPFIPGPLPSSPGITAPSTTIPRSALSRDPDRHLLATVVVRQSDVSASRTVALIPNGNLLNQPTLDLCNGTYPSEALRTARLQVADVDASSDPSLSTEAVLYRNPAASAQAFTELRKVSAACPDRPVMSPVGEGTATTVFHAAPDGTWAQVPTVDRQAYSFTSSSPATATAPASTVKSVAVYLRRGRALLGLYFANPGALQPAVGGQRTIEGIVALFEARMAKLPASAVGS